MKSKKCSKCQIFKPLDKFDLSRGSADGWYYYCKECRKDWNRKSQQNRRVRIREIVHEAKHMEPCADCSIRYPYYVMQFDHRDPKIKKFNISAFTRNSGWAMKKLHDEIGKCDIVCANCHAERHHGSIR